MSDVIPFLTLEDKINAVEVLGDDKPAIIVEGVSDVSVYEKLLSELAFDWENLDIVCSGSKSNIRNNYNTFPFEFVAILDADYDLYTKKLITDSRIVYTDFYTMENYLTTEGVIDELSKNYSTVREKYIKGEVFLEEIYQSVELFILLCYEKLHQGWAIKLEDIGLESWGYKNGEKIDAKLIESDVKKQLLEHHGLTIYNIDWTDIKKRLTVELDDGLDIRTIVSGKRLCDALFYKMQSYYPTFMKGKKKNLFKRDLSMYLCKDPHAKEFMKRIESACVICLGKEIVLDDVKVS